MNKKVAVCIVDAQNDFINVDGKLSVDGADKIRGTLGEVAKFAHSRGLVLYFTQDAHDGSEPEMQCNGGPFPYHCMMRTNGQKNIVEATPSVNDVVFQKNGYDVFDTKFGNQLLAPWLKKSKITEVYIAGVVGNICVEAHVRGLVKLGIGVTIFEDAIVWMDLDKGIFCEDQDNKEKSIQRMKSLGVNFARFVI